MKKTRMLKKNYEFSNVLSKGKYYSGKMIEAFVLESINNYNYLGLAISKKAGHAYQRNRVRRLIKECYRLHELEIIKNISVIFLWKKNVDIKTADFYQIEKDMLEILKKAKVIGVK